MSATAVAAPWPWLARAGVALGWAALLAWFVALGLHERRFTPLPGLEPGAAAEPATSRKLRFNGWYPAESDFRWSRGRTATLRFRAPPLDWSRHEVLVRFAFTAGPQRVSVRWNDVPVDTFEASGAGGIERRLRAPAGAATAVEQEIVFEIPTPRMPSHQDPRQLGIAFQSLRLVAAAPSEQDRP